MTIINFDDIIGKKLNTITNNIFCLSHPKNALIIGKTNSGKKYFILIAQNSIYEKIYVYSNNLDDKYKWLKYKFKDDVFIYIIINEINFDKIDKEYINLIIFDNLVFSNKKYLNFIVEVEN